MTGRWTRACVHWVPVTVLTSLLLNGCRLELVAGVPSLDLEISGGCGDIFVYKTSVDRREAVVVSVNVRDLVPPSGQRTIDLKNTPSGVEVRVDMYASRPRSLSYCNDVVIADDLPSARWRAVEGTLTITLERNAVTFRGTYRAGVRLENAVFESSGGRQVRQREPILIEAMVGWYAG